MIVNNEKLFFWRTFKGLKQKHEIIQCISKMVGIIILQEIDIHALEKLYWMRTYFGKHCHSYSLIKAGILQLKFLIYFLQGCLFLNFYSNFMEIVVGSDHGLATSHYLKRWWPSLLTQLYITRPQWVKGKPGPFVKKKTTINFHLKFPRSTANQ